MSNRIFSTSAVSLIVTVTLALLLVGCGEKAGLKLGVDVPDQAPVKLSQILANPAEYNGKNVVIRGVVSGQCSSLCEFFFKEGTDAATIFPQGFKFPKLETGKAVTVYAQITAGPQNVVFSALGLRM